MANTVDADRVQEFGEASEEVFEAKLEELANMVRHSRYTVFYTGAGMSTAAGIGDYRGPSGAWTLRRIRDLQRQPGDAAAAAELRQLLAEQRREQAKAATQVPMTDAQPTLSHMMQATLMHAGRAHFVVTTNLDGIYRKAGLQAHDHVCFLHGDVYTERCTACGYDFERNWHVRQSSTHVHDHAIGACSRCGSAPPSAYTGQPKAGSKTGADARGFQDNGLIGTRDRGVGTKDTHINFGECLDKVDWEEAERHCSKADLCIVMGTSMSLRHITHFPFQAKRTVIVNLQKTPDDAKCHLRIWAQCDPVSAGLLARLGLEPLRCPTWCPRDALPLKQIPAYVAQPYREAAGRLEGLIQQAQAAENDEALARRLAGAGLDPAPPQAPLSIRLGNTHKRVSPDSGHAWELYVDGDGAPLLSCVEVRLHPTFQPSLYKLERMPFRLSCNGWGTFDIHVRLHTKAGEHKDVIWPLQFDKDDEMAIVQLP